MERKLTLQIPGYIKYFFILAAMVLTLYVAVVGQFLFKPLLAAMIVAILLKPLASRLEKWTHSRLLSVTIVVVLLLVLVGLLFLFIFSQVQNITEDTETLVQGFGVVLDKVQEWLQKIFGFSPDKQISMLKGYALDFVKKISSFLPGVLMATADFFAELLLFIIALCFFLYYRRFLVNFLFKLSKASTHAHLKLVLDSIQAVLKKYILGVSLVILITGTLNTAGLLILGINHAIFFGTVAGLLTIIPYIGIVVGSLLPVLFCIASNLPLWYPLAIILIFCFVQFLEGNFITPKIVGKQLSLNPLASLLALFIAGKFFGIMGIILSLPCLATIKVILDHVRSWKLYGYLLGNEESNSKKNY